MKKKVGIIGGGFTGLGAAYKLANKFDVTIIESSNTVAGLASGFKMPEWEWPVDKFVHHWFANDNYIIGLAKELGLEDKIILLDTKSSCYYNGKIAELDSPMSLLKLPFIPFIDRLRMGLVMAYLRFYNNWKKFESETSYSFLKRTMGERAFKVVWKPLFVGKFGKYADKVNAAWFWARVNPRTKKLAYFEGGFQELANHITKYIENKGGKVILGNPVKSVKKNGKKFVVETQSQNYEFDIVIEAVPISIFSRLTKDLPKEYTEKIRNMKSLWAQYFVIELKESFLNKIYWLNINDEEFPFMLVAEHTNFMDKKHFNNHHIIYVGKYLDEEDPLLKMNEEDLFNKISEYLKKINPNFSMEKVVKKVLFRMSNAQPILPLNYSKEIPSVETPLKNLYVANMNHVYPWDRGTNNAVEVGFRVANLIYKKEKIEK